MEDTYGGSIHCTEFFLWTFVKASELSTFLYDSTCSSASMIKMSFVTLYPECDCSHP